MLKNIIIDTGPLVALLNKKDKFHKWAKEIVKNIKSPFLTCESVISEACFLLRNIKNGPISLISLLARKMIVISFSLSEEIENIKKLISKYSDISISLADACLVRMSENYPLSLVFTIDSDFTVYRKENRQVIQCIFPPE